VGKADSVYAMYLENIDFVRYAKSKGMKIVVDFYERPTTYKLLIEEIKSTPEFDVFKDYVGEYEVKHSIRMKYIEEILQLADKYTIPSKHVLMSLEEFKNFDSSKASLLPYPSSITPGVYNWKPIKHRVLFVGSDPINKGLLYCAKAATQLKRVYPDLDFRVAGSGFDVIQNQYTFKDLNFIGFLNKEQLIAEFRSAEVFVFPTLFEGFAGVILEASSCGCPIITTINSGVDSDEFPGIIIPEKDSQAIYKNVVELFENKVSQQGLSVALFEYAKKLHPDVYKKRLVSLFEEI
jgi:glycosyltransferase involved in cell wall biosynthesis